jgi:hypothetical protein
MDVGRLTLNLFGQFLRGSMRSFFEQTAQKNPSRGGSSTAAFAQEIQDFFDPIVVGRGVFAGILGG